VTKDVDIKAYQLLWNVCKRLVEIVELSPRVWGLRKIDSICQDIALWARHSNPIESVDERFSTIDAPNAQSRIPSNVEELFGVSPEPEKMNIDSLTPSSNPLNKSVKSPWPNFVVFRDPDARDSHPEKSKECRCPFFDCSSLWDTHQSNLTILMANFSKSRLGHLERVITEEQSIGENHLNGSDTFGSQKELVDTHARTEFVSRVVKKDIVPFLGEAPIEVCILVRLECFKSKR